MKFIFFSTLIFFSYLTAIIVFLFPTYYFLLVFMDLDSHGNLLFSSLGAEKSIQLLSASIYSLFLWSPTNHLSLTSLASTPSLKVTDSKG